MPFTTYRTINRNNDASDSMAAPRLLAAAGFMLVAAFGLWRSAQHDRQRAAALAFLDREFDEERQEEPQPPDDPIKRRQRTSLTPSRTGTLTT